MAYLYLNEVAIDAENGDGATYELQQHLESFGVEVQRTIDPTGAAFTFEATDAATYATVMGEIERFLADVKPKRFCITQEFANGLLAGTVLSLAVVLLCS